ncbi:GNAT family N-acetyltransferase [Iodobacter sp.]|uniref:GNAT family N-acetyltransferase n=1 Tax=Iodobacter sp. TaxID=1915058 RepID=UPI0025F36ADD|nr:GNAT family N-acetyltransferase [Iodobacter sp.]
MLNIHYRQLDIATDIAALQALLESAPAYSLLVEGYLPQATAAIEAMQALPPDSSPDNKFVFGFYLNERLIGCADLCRHYPETGIAYLGLLLFDELFQGQGFGSIAMQQLKSIAQSWQCQRIRIAVIANNTAALAFWQRQGFIEPYKKPTTAYADDAIVMECV